MYHSDGIKTKQNKNKNKTKNNNKTNRNNKIDNQRKVMNILINAGGLKKIGIILPSTLKIWCGPSFEETWISIT